MVPGSMLKVSGLMFKIEIWKMKVKIREHEKLVSTRGRKVSKEQSRNVLYLMDFYDSIG